MGAPAYGDQWLANLGSVTDAVRTFCYSTGAVVANGTTSVFAKTLIGGAFEGLVTGISFYIDSEDYQTSPVTLGILSANTSGTGQVHAQAVFNAPVGKQREAVFAIPPLGQFPAGFRFLRGEAIGLQVTNNESTSIYCEGTLVGVFWDQDRREQAQRALAQVAPWRPGMFTQQGGH